VWKKKVISTLDVTTYQTEGSLTFLFAGNESFIHWQGSWSVGIVLLLLINLSGPIEVTAAAHHRDLSFSNERGRRSVIQQWEGLEICHSTMRGVGDLSFNNERGWHAFTYIRPSLLKVTALLSYRLKMASWKPKHVAVISFY